MARVVTWQLGAFAILAVALAGGFAWYERTRPDARVVALVAALAALGALGRIAFAAFPNVKPTTDIVLIAGYALGAGPGFAVGALAGLTSNFFFGQGPWTPWQMAAWGVVGAIGALLALLARNRPPSRVALGLACAVVGFGFTAVQDLGDWVTYSDHSLGALGVYVGKGLGFDAVHAVGCLVFAIAFGPGLVRAISRFAARLDVHWQPVAPALLAAICLAGLLGAPGASAAPSPVTYLESAQNADGGLGPAPGQASSALYSGWAALGLAAAGVNPRSVVKDGHSLASYVSQSAASSGDPGDLERTILATSAAGVERSDLVMRLRGRIRGDGSVSGQTNLTAFAILALRAGGAGAPGPSVLWLEHQQDPDGGFNYATAGAASDVDDTGAALEALAGSGDAGGVGGAIHFLHAAQNDDGGFPSQPGQSSNAQSTAWAVQGLLAVGAGGDVVARAQGYLRTLIGPDGHVSYARGSEETPVWVTAQAMMALAAKPLPLASPATPSAPARSVPRRPTRAPRHHAPRRRGGPRSRSAWAPSALSERLAASAGVLMAVALAPVGGG